jgi:hypothetical protein
MFLVVVPPAHPPNIERLRVVIVMGMDRPRARVLVALLARARGHVTAQTSLADLRARSDLQLLL